MASFLPQAKGSTSETGFGKGILKFYASTRPEQFREHSVNMWRSPNFHWFRRVEMIAIKTAIFVLPSQPLRARYDPETSETTVSVTD